MTIAKTIWKFPLKGPRCSIEMPEGATVLTVQAQFEEPMIWAEVDPAAKKIKRKFLSVPTGAAFDHDGAHYVGTFQIRGGALVFHVYTDRVEYPVDDSSVTGEPKKGD